MGPGVRAGVATRATAAAAAAAATAAAAAAPVEAGGAAGDASSPVRLGRTASAPVGAFHSPPAAIPQKRQTPDSRDHTRGRKVAATQPRTRPTPDSLAFQRLGQLRRRSHGSTPQQQAAGWDDFGETPGRAMCPPTPRRAVSVKKAAAAAVEVVLGSGSVPDLHYLERIGQGAFATVAVVVDASGRRLALKENRTALARHTGAWSRFRETTRLWASLGEHAHIVAVRFAWTEAGSGKVLMDLCEAGNLLQYVDACMAGGRPWGEDQMWRCLGDAAAGLRHVHEHKLCHNDVKPGNLFVGGDPLRVMLGDFGNLSRAGAALDGEEGDFRYLSKEALEKGKSSFASDLFSLGISFYEVVADVVLPEVGMWHQLREGRIPELPRRLSRDLYVLLCELMHPRPPQRPAAEAVLAHARVTSHRRCMLKPVVVCGVDNKTAAAAAAAKGNTSPDNSGSAFVTTPLSDSLQAVATPRSRVSPAQPLGSVDERMRTAARSRDVQPPTIDPPCGEEDSGGAGGGEGGQGNNDDDSGDDDEHGVGGGGSSGGEGSNGVSASPRRCLLSYFDDMECR